MTSSQKIVPCLWCDGNAKELTEFYASIFPASRINATMYYPKSSEEGLADFQQNMAGKELTIDFELVGYRFTALNGGPVFKPNPSISFFITGDNKGEIDKYWQALSAGGKTLMPLQKYPFSDYYGWVQDKFGVAWQLILKNPAGGFRAKVMTSLMFIHANAGKAEEALRFYVSVFKDSEAGNIFPYEPEDNLPEPPGSVAYEDFKLLGQWFTAMDSASREHDFDLNEAVSLMVLCEDQAEIDYYWEKLSTVPEAEQCGWLKDKYGVSWQIVPKNVGELLKTPGAFQRMMKMKKLDIAELVRA